MKKPKIIFLMGPTAAGKTDAAMRLADDLPSALISVDSAMVYRGMDIGTAKPSPETLSKYPHELINIRDVTQAYSAASFRNDARQIIDTHLKNNKIPVLVGGTMLYFRALSQGLAQLPEASPALRATLNQKGQEKGWVSMHQQLAQLDPESAQRIHPNDPQRIQRALEVYYMTGVPLSLLVKQSDQANLPYEICAINLAPADRAILHERIASRFTQMIQQGFLDEAHRFYSNPTVQKELPSMRSVGYRQAWEYFDALYSKEVFIEKGIAATRQLAKRQLTWLRHWPEIKWFDSSDNFYPDVLKTIQQFLEI